MEHTSSEKHSSRRKRSSHKEHKLSPKKIKLDSEKNEDKRLTKNTKQYGETAPPTPDLKSELEMSNLETMSSITNFESELNKMSKTYTDPKQLSEKSDKSYIKSRSLSETSSDDSEQTRRWQNADTENETKDIK